MPGSTGVLTQGYQPTFFPIQGSVQLLGNLNNNSQVKAQTAGALCVYPNSPLGLSVLVDTGFMLWQTAQAPSAFFLNQNGGSPVTVTLVVPGSNSYYATIYWDQVANNYGVVYGASGVSPTPILPNNMWQTPLACVLLASTTTQVTASLITDARRWWTFAHGDFANTAFGAGGASFNLAGCTDAWIFIKITASGGVLTLSNMRASQKIYLLVFNNTAGALTMFASFTNPAGTLLNTQKVNRTGGAGSAWGVSTGAQSFAASGTYSPNEAYWETSTQPLFS